jgi:hypothetical protein
MPVLGQYSPQTAINADYLGRVTAAAGAVTPGILGTFTFAVTDAATSDIDIVVTEKFEVLDVICRKDSGAGAGNTMQIKNGATAISDAIACAVDKTVTRAGTIDVAQNVIAAGGTLRLTATKAAGTRTALVTVIGISRP